MKSVKNLFFFFLFGANLICVSAFSQTAPNSSSPATLNLKPIEVNYTTLSGLHYSIGDETLSNYVDFEQLLFPLKDYETIRLLKQSESSELRAKIFNGVGLAGFATGIVGLLTSPSNQQIPFWITAIGGGISLDVGGLFFSESQTTKFNSVQRYNRFARGEEQVMPQGPSDEKSLLQFDKTENGPKNHPSKKSK
ncbi:MAG TPA: hypothetical protein VIJ93_08960 [bacterium]